VEKARHTFFFRFDGKRNIDGGSVDGTILQGRDPKKAFARVDDFNIPVRIEPQIPHGQAGQKVDPAAGGDDT